MHYDRKEDANDQDANILQSQWKKYNTNAKLMFLFQLKGNCNVFYSAKLNEHV